MKLAIVAVLTGVTLMASYDHALAQSPVDVIGALAAKSDCAKINWKNRGLAPKSYMSGVAVVFAKSVCQMDRADVKAVSAAKGASGGAFEKTDALTWYDAQFRNLNMSNDKDGVDTLRHAYVLLIGLGMRESSGRHCVGRDKSAGFSKADNAEAGLFQTSWGANKRHPTLSKLYDDYKKNEAGCLLETFKQKSIRCNPWDAKVWGEGTGADWQVFTKRCPAFATEYAAVLMRVSGGSKGEFGPLRTRATELRRECHAMLTDVQALVQSKPEICAALK